MDYQDILYDEQDHVATITMNRPKVYNAFGPRMCVELIDALQRAGWNTDIGAIVLTGAGDLAFCAGADLKALAAVGQSPPDELVGAYMDRPEGPMGFTRLTPSKPTIAAISGYCLAGGLELALWCDLRVATETARLGYPERRWGVPLVDGGTQRLPRVIGLGRALDLILSGRIIEVAEAR